MAPALTSDVGVNPQGERQSTRELWGVVKLALGGVGYSRCARFVKLTVLCLFL